MDAGIRKHLYNIKTAISLIEEFYVDVPNLSLYILDAKTKSAVERQLGIIGDAARQILLLDASIRLVNADNIVAISNRIIHTSDSIDDSLVWDILRTHLPRLKKEINSLLHNE